MDEWKLTINAIVISNVSANKTNVGLEYYGLSVDEFLSISIFSLSNKEPYFFGFVDYFSGKSSYYPVLIFIFN